MSHPIDNETISLAIKSLKKAIDRIARKRSIDNRTQRQLETLVDHTHYLLKQLVEKRQSLRALLEWFREEWNRLELELPIHSLAILQHSIQIFVRCQDGLVMLTSGECRHPGDIRQAKKTKFPSRLSTLKERQDGYTCLYKTDALYSGYGWDEFANENVGIQARLTSILKKFLKSDPWEYLDRQGATQLLESLLDQQESAVKDLQQELQGLKQKMIQDIHQRLRPTKLSFVTQDKMERLTVASQQRTIRLERRADNFQIQGSVLPNEFNSAKDWQPYSLHVETAPDTSTKRKRLVIEDSDSEEEEEAKEKSTKRKSVGKTAQTKKTVEKSSGLVVRVETSKPKAETEDSLTAIKTQMGVDVQGLESAHEELQQETAENRQAIHHKEEKVTRMKKIFQRTQQRHHVDDNEVWDARECLRHSCMELGNDCLWLSKNLEKALDSFQQAKRLVKEQQAAHRSTTKNTNDESDESRYIERNLMFLLGQASVNVGIVLVEWSHEQKKTAGKKINEAVREFQQVRKLAEDMRRHAKSDQQKLRENSSEWLEAMADILKADQLESLACRWMGLALWSSFQEKQAINALDDASSFFNGAKKSFCDHILDDFLEVAAECIYATCTLTDLTCSAMERLGRSSKQRGDELLLEVEKSLRRHAEISQRLEELALEESFFQTVQLFMKEHEISSSKDILENLNGIKRWWENVKKQPAGLVKENCIPRISSILPRSDLFSEGAQRHTSEPTAHIIVSEGSRRRKKKQSQSSTNILRNSYSQNAVHALEKERSKTSHCPIKYRKWGDGLLSQEAVDSETAGEAQPKLKYPCVAPPMPPEIQILFSRQ